MIGIQTSIPNIYSVMSYQLNKTHETSNARPYLLWYTEHFPKLNIYMVDDILMVLIGMSELL
jgi:hypothetical protein